MSWVSTLKINEYLGVTKMLRGCYKGTNERIENRKDNCDRMKYIPRVNFCMIIGV